MTDSFGSDVRASLGAALPVMLGYLAIGLPCGVMAAQIGLSPLAAFVVSCTFYTGAGQFMMSSMWLAGTPLASMIVSISLVGSRQMLYSAALAPYLEGVGKRESMLYAATVTDETFGVNLEKFASREPWSCRRATLVNVMSMLSWASANAVGVAVGSALDLPVDIMSFAMTSIFICLLVGQRWDARNVRVVVVSFVVVAICRGVGLTGVAIFLGAVAGVVAGLVKVGGRA